MKWNAIAVYLQGQPEIQRLFPPSEQRTRKAKKAWDDFEFTVKTEQIQVSVPQIRLKAIVPFVPPKPNEFDKATSIFMERASLAQ